MKPAANIRQMIFFIMLLLGLIESGRKHAELRRALLYPLTPQTVCSPNVLSHQSCFL
jgi:hypothetical protein